MARYGVLPLNNPPYFPRYNGAMEKGNRELKTALDQRWQTAAGKTNDFTLAVELTTHDLNHQSRRCLKGRTACAVFHDDAQHGHWTKRQRHDIFRLLLHRFGAMIGNTTNGRHPRPATAWRVSVESRLRCQTRLLSVKTRNQRCQPLLPNVGLPINLVAHPFETNPDKLFSDHPWHSGKFLLSTVE